MTQVSDYDLRSSKDELLDPYDVAEPVELPVCPRCGLVGKQPRQLSLQFFCSGPREGQHKRTRMRPVRFVPERTNAP